MDDLLRPSPASGAVVGVLAGTAALLATNYLYSEAKSSLSALPGDASSARGVSRRAAGR